MPEGPDIGERARVYPFISPLSPPPGLPSGSGLPGNPSSYPKAFKMSQDGPG